MTFDLSLPLLLLSVAVSLFWMWYLVRPRRHPLPWRVVGLAGLLGALASPVVLAALNLLQHAWPDLAALSGSPRVGLRALYLIVMVGFLEESVLMTSVRATTWYSRAFDRVEQGAILSSAAALGFATVENARYLAWNGLGVLAGRALLSTLGHVLFSMVWGFAIGLQKAGANGSAARPVGTVEAWILLAESVALAAILHGAYDLLLAEGQLWLAVLLVLVLWRIFLGQLDAAERAAP